MDIEGLQEKLKGINAKAVGLEAEVSKLQVKMIETKETRMIEFRESNAYKLELNMTIA